MPKRTCGSSIFSIASSSDSSPRKGKHPVDREEIIKQIATYVKQRMAADRSGHDWWHVYRVWQNARSIAEVEQADLFVVELAALLHDIADWKFHAGDESVGPRMARACLEEVQVDLPTIDHVCQIIAALPFKGAGVPSPMATLEGRVVQDADRLDALGAIGIARAFAYGGHAGRAIYDPEVPPEQHLSFEAYKRSTGSTINHFYEKLLLLKDRMNTPTGRRMADGSHFFMQAFLDRFFSEWGALPASADAGSAESKGLPERDM